MSSERIRGKATRILVLNPNSSQSMTDGMRAAVGDPGLGLPYSTEIHAYTAPPAAPASINDAADIARSTEVVLADLQSEDRDPGERPSAYDGILVACYSVHPLVRELRSSRCAVTGIFEASVLTALSLLPAPWSLSSSSSPPDNDEQQQQQWGIVTTGKFWEEHLTAGVQAFLGTSSDARRDPSSRFAGVESTGLNASDFHNGVSPEVVREKLKRATKRLLKGGRTTVIVMGCAGMAGLEEIIRSAAAEEVGERFAYDELHVLDGVRAGIMQLEIMIKQQRLRGQRR
ncbi:hypothetical protein DL770_006702 [Monosporascus sp. CRB-9-2]|nr:hypothetical protein DL770_006702 [Monosporascus sp. CRB-9-2]